MKTIIIHCDICKREIPLRGWEDEPRHLSINTFCTSQNPMQRITKDSQFQGNTFIADEVCQSCMRKLASSIADAIEAIRKSAAPKTNTNTNHQ